MQAFQRHGVWVAFPAQALHHVASLEVTSVRAVDGAVHRLIQPIGCHVGLHVANHVGGGGFDTIRLRIEHAGVYTHGMVRLVVSPRVVGHRTVWHAYVAARHAQFGEYYVLHGMGKIALQRDRGDMPEQANTGVGIAALLARCGLRFPLLKVVHHLIVRHFVWKLQRQATCGIGSQVQQACLVDGMAFERWQILARVV